MTNKKNVLIIDAISEKGNEEEEYIEGFNREGGSPAARPPGTVSMEGSF